MTISMSKRWPIVYLLHFNFKFDDLATKSKTVEFPNSCEDDTLIGVRSYSRHTL